MNINAAWSAAENQRYICKWFISWKSLPEGGMIGAIAGYSGAGAFEVERFRVWSSNDLLTSLWIDFTDHISNEEIDFNSLPANELLICEDSLDELWCWNDNEVWNKNESVVLVKSLLPKLLQKNDLFTYQNSTSNFLSTLCKKIGLTSSP